MAAITEFHLVGVIIVYAFVSRYVYPKKRRSSGNGSGSDSGFDGGGGFGGGDGGGGDGGGGGE